LTNSSGREEARSNPKRSFSGEGNSTLSCSITLYLSTHVWKLNKKRKIIIKKERKKERNRNEFKEKFKSEGSIARLFMNTQVHFHQNNYRKR